MNYLAHTYPPPDMGTVYAAYGRGGYPQPALRAAGVSDELRCYSRSYGKPIQIVPYRPNSLQHGYILVATGDMTVTDDELLERAARLRANPPTEESNDGPFEVLVGHVHESWERHVEREKDKAKEKRKAARQRQEWGRQNAQVRRRIKEIAPWLDADFTGSTVEMMSEDLLELLERLARAEQR